DKGPLLIQLHLRGRGGKSPPTRRAVGGRGRPPEGRSGSRCSCRRRRGGWSVGCRNHRPGEPARRKPCRRAGDYRTGACPCVRRSEPCRSCNTADGVAVCHSGRKRSSCPDPVGRRPGKQGFDSKSGSGRPSQAGSGIGRNNQLSSLEVIVGQRLPSFNAPETPPMIPGVQQFAEHVEGFAHKVVLDVLTDKSPWNDLNRTLPIALVAGQF